VKRVAVLVGCLLVVSEAAAQAQIAAALGRPLRDRSAKPGTVQVRVINGDPSKPIVGTNVTIKIGDKSRAVRTDAEGRARFFKLPIGVKAVVTVKVGENSSDSRPFQIPAEGGIRLLMSPVPWNGPTGGPAMGGRGRPNPKQMSGRVRPDASIPNRGLRARLLQGTFQNSAIGATVHAVGYRADGKLFKVTKKSGKDGRVLFENLDNSGRVAYYVLSVVPRGDHADRLVSFPVMLPARGGVVMMLVGDAPDAKAETDDLSRYYQQPTAPLPAGEVRVEIGSAMKDLGPVELVEIGRRDAVAQAPVATVPPPPSAIKGAVGKTLPDDQLPAGSLMVEVHRRTKGSPPISGATVSINKKGDNSAEAVKLATTGGTGLVRQDGLEIGATYVLTVTVHGRKLEPKEIVIAKDKGQRVTATANWIAINTLAARFTNITASPDAVFTAQTRYRGELYRSAPFQLVPGRGTFVRVLVVPKLMFRFHLGGRLDDRFMVFQGQFALNNVSYAPWVPKDGELLMPLPDGFAGAQVANENQDNVKIVDKKGFLWKGFGGAIPPGGLDFRAAFTLPLENGTVSFDMPLPWGVFNSNLTFDYSPGMKVEVPGRASGQVRQTESGQKFYVMRGITILPKQRMVMRIKGLPQYEAWHRYVNYAVGIGVLLLLGFAIFGVARARRREQVDERAALARKREQLLEDLVALERKHEANKITDKKYERTKENLVKQLERVYAQLDGQERAAA
jgi:hypothetical protein